MQKYRIFSRAGLDLGVYEGATEQDAIDDMVRDAGYTEDHGWWDEYADPRHWILVEVDLRSCYVARELPEYI
jgi:hypothetical protein